MVDSSWGEISKRGLKWGSIENVHSNNWWPLRVSVKSREYKELV